MSLQAHQETFNSLEAEWRALAPRAAMGSIFTHPAWLRAWWDTLHTSETLHLLALRDGQRLAGIAPMMKAGGAIRFLGSSDVCDYHEIVAAPGAEEACLAALLEHAARCGWRTLELDGLQAGGPTLALLPALARHRGWAVEEAQDAVAPMKRLPATWDAYLESLPGKHRHELRRKMRKLSAAGQVKVSLATAPAEVAERFPVFVELMKSSREDKAQFMTPERERFFHHLSGVMAAEGLLRLYFLELDSLTVAASMLFDYGGTFHLYNSGYNTRYAPLSAGIILKALIAEEAINEGRREYHFLRGAEPYKFDLGAEEHRLTKLTLRR